eukprot:11079327-Lingulodinium_polyedra.AAC.1
MSGHVHLEHAFGQWQCETPRSLENTSADTMIAQFTIDALCAGSQLCAGPTPAPSLPCLAPVSVAAITMASASQQQQD